MHKDIFVNKYEYSNIMKDYKNIFTKIKKLKLYMVKFNKNNTIKLKIYFFNYIVKEDEC